MPISFIVYVVHKEMKSSIDHTTVNCKVAFESPIALALEIGKMHKKSRSCGSQPQPANLIEERVCKQ